MAASIEKLQEKLQKLQKTLERHVKAKAKKEALLATAAESDLWWIEGDIESLSDSIRKTSRKISETADALASAAAAKKAAEKAEAELPEELKLFRDRLVTEWDAYDRKERDSILEQGEAYWRENGGSYSIYTQMESRTDQNIHEANLKDANGLVANFLNRILKIVGKPSSFGFLYVNSGNSTEGGLAINGFVTGNKGIADVKSIHAGGYNIQRLHIRVLVKAYKA